MLSRPEAVTARRPLERSFGGGRTTPPHLTTKPQPPWGDDVPSSHQPVGAEGDPYTCSGVGGGWLAEPCTKGRGVWDASPPAHEPCLDAWSYQGRSSFRIISVSLKICKAGGRGRCKWARKRVTRPPGSPRGPGHLPVLLHPPCLYTTDVHAPIPEPSTRPHIACEPRCFPMNSFNSAPARPSRETSVKTHSRAFLSPKTLT